jgi:hypothetical protein
VAIFEEETCDKKAYFSPRHTDNSDEVSDEESQVSNKFHRTSATTGPKRSVFTMKATYQWALHLSMLSFRSMAGNRIEKTDRKFQVRFYTGLC